jgi:hypothetical protein
MTNDGERVGDLLLGDGSGNNAGATPPPPQTNAITRSWAHLNIGQWASMIMLGAAVRSMALHPLYVAIARKRVSTSDESVLSILKSLRHSEGGVRNLYRGFTGETSYNVFGEMTNLLVIEYARAKLQQASTSQSSESSELVEERSYGRDAAAGVLGDLAMMAVVTPLTVICSRQMNAGYGACKDVPYMGTWATAKDIYRKNGIRGLYSGTWASILMLPGGAVWWACYGECKFWYYRAARWASGEQASPSGTGGSCNPAQTPWYACTQDNALINCAASVTASALWALTMNPFTVVRTRLQSSDNLRIRDVVPKLWKEQGWRGFMRGTVLTMNVAIFDGVLFALLYEFTKIGSDMTRQGQGQISQTAEASAHVLLT